MSRKCYFCQKGPFSGNNVSHSNVKLRRRWLPNLKKMRSVINGTTKTIRVCTRCIRSGKIVRPLKRIFSPSSPEKKISV